MGTHKEHDGNKEKKKKKLLPPILPEKENNWTLHYHMLSLSLAACNFWVLILFHIN